MNAVPLSAALEAVREVRANAVAMEKRIDQVFKFLRPGFTPPPEAGERLRDRLLPLVAEYFKEAIPVGSIDPSDVLALFHAAVAVAYVGNIGPSMTALEAELVTQLGAEKGPVHHG